MGSSFKGMHDKIGQKIKARGKETNLDVRKSFGQVMARVKESADNAEAVNPRPTNWAGTGRSSRDPYEFRDNFSRDRCKKTRT